MMELIVVPYDSGRRAWRMGSGPLHLIERGLVHRLAAQQLDSHESLIETDAQGELDTALDLARGIARATSSAAEQGRFPVVLAGNCIASVGAVAGLGSHAAIAWFDAHADFNTPDTSPSGFLDGMTLAVMTGRCYREAAARIPGFAVLPDSELVLIGVRAIDIDERAVVDGITRARTAPELDHALQNCTRKEIYLHVDLDVLDPAVLRANNFATPEGLSVAALLELVAAVARHKRLRGLSITAYDPACDDDDAAIEIVVGLIAAAAS